MTEIDRIKYLLLGYDLIAVQTGHSRKGNAHYTFEPVSERANRYYGNHTYHAGGDEAVEADFMFYFNLVCKVIRP